MPLLIALIIAFALSSQAARAEGLISKMGTGKDGSACALQLKLDENMKVIGLRLEGRGLEFDSATPGGEFGAVLKDQNLNYIDEASFQRLGLKQTESFFSKSTVLKKSKGLNTHSLRIEIRGELTSPLSVELREQAGLLGHTLAARQLSCQLN